MGLRTPHRKEIYVGCLWDWETNAEQWWKDNVEAGFYTLPGISEELLKGFFFSHF